jgi:hypothetical protein
MQPAGTCVAMKTWQSITEWQFKGLQLCHYDFFNVLEGKVHPVTGHEVPENK